MNCAPPRSTALATCAAAVTLLATLLAAPSRAGHIPDPSQCEVEAHWSSCPAGDLRDRVLLRMFTGNPDAFIDTRVSVCGCSDVHFAPLTGGEGYGLDSACAMTELTDQNGIADFYPRAGGVCSGVPMLITGYSVPVAFRYSWASPDQDGDLVVSSPDMVLIQQKIGTSDPTADLDGDGLVTASDLTIAQTHLGHSALGPVDVPPGGSAGATSLAQSWPNPCDTRSTVAFRLVRPEHVTLTVFDLAGREMAVPLRDVAFDTGPHQISFDARGLATGLYLYRLRAGDFMATRRLIVYR